MGAILAFILPLLSQLPSTIGDYFRKQQEIQAAKQQAELELQKANIQLAGELAKANMELSKEVLSSTGRGFKYFTFGMWFGPYMAQLLYPPIGKQIFENLLGMPQWYAQSCVAIMFTVWGISVGSTAIANIFSGISEFYKNKQIFKAALSPNVDNAALFELIRSVMPNKQLSQEQVDKINDSLQR